MLHPARQPVRPSKVLFVGAMGRSGSTVLELMLAGLEGFSGVGELRYIWKMGLIENRLCGCGEHFRACPFWKQVGREAFAGWDIDPHQVLAVKDKVERHRAFLDIRRHSGQGRVTADLRWYIGVLSKLYAGIQGISGASVIVDSSKTPPYFFALKRATDLDLRLLHLVRDPRGVVYSWKKRVTRPDVVDGSTYMPTMSTLKAAGLWADYNLIYHVAGNVGVPRMFLRYEDFIASPRDALTSLVRFVDATVSDEQLAAIGSPHVPVPVSHAIGGNPARFREGEMTLRLDVDWKTQLPRSVQMGVYAATWPLARKYGYPVA